MYIYAMHTNKTDLNSLFIFTTATNDRIFDIAEYYTIVIAYREQMYAYCRALGCCLYEMCSRQKLFPVRHSPTVSGETEGRTLPRFLQQYSADLAEVWHR